MAQRAGGLFKIRENGVSVPAVGEWSFGMGIPKRKGIMGTDGAFIAATSEAVVPFIEGEIVNNGIDLEKLFTGEGLTVSAEMENGQVVVMTQGFWAGDPTVQIGGEGRIKVRYEGAEVDVF